MTSADTQKRATIAAFIAMNAAMLPLYANLITVLTSPSAFGRQRSFPLALGVVLVIVTLLRWKRALGAIVNALVALAAVLALFWSDEPLTYLAYTLYLTVAVLFLHGLIYFFTMRKHT